jgi:hypothetical protein
MTMSLESRVQLLEMVFGDNTNRVDLVLIDLPDGKPNCARVKGVWRNLDNVPLATLQRCRGHYKTYAGFDIRSELGCDPPVQRATP